MRRSLGFALPLVAVASTALSPEDGLIALNKTLNGRVQPVVPFALPCFSLYEGKPVRRDDAICAERQANYLDPLYRREFPGAYMFDTSSINASDPTSEDKCLLDNTNPKNPAAWEGRDCKLGNLPSNYIAIRDAHDASAAFKHARKYGIKLSIKNSGHTYMEDASMADSLLLWTRNLRQLSHDAKFVPERCSREDTFNAITIGAGIGCGEAYEFADAHNSTILCGYSPTVGLSGGWVQSAGHSVLSNVYGLGVDRVVQFRVVTPDGRLRVANKCQNADLFWALRGGGGGTFGLVLESTHIVEESAPMAIALVGLSAGDKNASHIGDFMDVLVDTAVDLAEDGWGGHIYGSSIVYLNPLVKTVGEAEKSLQKVLEFIQSYGGTTNITISPTFYSFFRDVVLPTAKPVGTLQIIGTQLAPIKVFLEEKGRQKLKGFFRKEIAKGNIPYIPVGSPYLSRKTRKADQTAANPAWYDSLWEPGLGNIFAWNSTFDERRTVVEYLQMASQELAEVTMGGAAYKNEANPFTENWKELWYGDNYEELLRIKRKYDPDNILRCWGCVGWTEQDAESSSYRAFLAITS